MRGRKRHHSGAEEVPFGRAKGVLGLVAGMAVVVLSLVLSFGFAGGQASDERAFLAAVPCAGPPVPAEDCLRVEAATVRTVREETSGRNTTREVELAGEGPGQGPVTGRVYFRHAVPVFSALEPGDRVRATVWRGRVVELSSGTRRQATLAGPVGDATETTVVAVVVSAVGVGLLGYGVWVLGLGRRPRSRTFWAGLGLAALVLGTVVATAGP
ncbi:hypothetical protein [Streptomyces sp. CC208A]|uniref:hypothetical protein n=1 Tax=Streptomyces sp. CC208A TaxID=3044573 RepID=UPI0024A81BF2|nr:hypothetical protein [Streptomyces sp. CC208A]